MPEIAFAGIYISKFSGAACPRTPLEYLARSALATCPPKTMTLATPLSTHEFYRKTTTHRSETCMAAKTLTLDLAIDPEVPEIFRHWPYFK